MADVGVAHHCRLCASGKGQIYSMQWDTRWRQEINKLKDGLGAEPYGQELYSSGDIAAPASQGVRAHHAAVQSWAGRGCTHQLTGWILMVGESQPSHSKQNGNSVFNQSLKTGFIMPSINLFWMM